MKPGTLDVSGAAINYLSVSSNGSTWVKLGAPNVAGDRDATFSILERIDVGETVDWNGNDMGGGAFQYPRTDRRG